MLPSTSSSGSHRRRCRCSSRPKTTSDSHRSGTRSAHGVRNVRGRFEEWTQQPSTRSATPGSRPARLRTCSASPPRSSSGRVRQTRRCGALDAVLPRTRIPGCCSHRGQPACDARRASRRPGRSPSASERARELAEAPGSNKRRWRRSPRSTGDHASRRRLPPSLVRQAREHGDRGFLSTSAPQLGRSLCALGRYDEAEPLAQLGRELGNEHDFATQTLWRQVRHSSTPTAASTPKRSGSPARRSRSPSARTDSTSRATRSATSPRCCTPPAAPRRPPRRSSRRSSATSASRTWRWSRRCARVWNG